MPGKPYATPPGPVPGAARDTPSDDGPAQVTERESPPTRRVIGVLNLLADHPRARLSLTEVAARLDLSMPTTLGILNELVDAGFASRDDAKTYGLGPALLRLGWSAETGLAALDLVRPHVQALHGKVGASCVLSTAQDGTIVLLDWIGAHLPGDQRDLVGERFPFTPPLGLVNAAWSADDVVAAWLDRAPLVPVRDDANVLDDLIADARTRGYLLERLTGNPTTANIVVSNVVASHLPSSVIATLLSLIPATDWSEYVLGPPAGAHLDIANVSAPIYDRRGTHRYTVTIAPERTGVPEAEYLTWIDALTACAEAATTAIGGHNPWASTG